MSFEIFNQVIRSKRIHFQITIACFSNKCEAFNPDRVSDSLLISNLSLSPTITKLICTPS